VTQTTSVSCLASFLLLVSVFLKEEFYF